MNASQQEAIILLEADRPGSTGAGTRSGTWVDVRDFVGAAHFVMAAHNLAKNANRKIQLRIESSEAANGASPTTHYTSAKFGNTTDNNHVIQWTGNLDSMGRYVRASAIQSSGGSSFDAAVILVATRQQGKAA